MNNRSDHQAQHTPRVLAITGGKGGVGKTSISVNLAIALSRNGSKVCLFDADTGLANINIMLGIHPPYTLEHLFTGEKSIQDIVLEGPERVDIVPGASGAAQCAELDLGQQQRLVTSFRSLEPHYDYMLVDTAAGISPTVLHFVAAAQVAVIVVTPEPTSLTDAFSLLKVLRRRGYRRKVQVIVNMAANSSLAEKVYRRFSGAVAKYLDLSTEYLGPVWMDESMRTAVSLQRPVALFPKHDPSARSFYRLAERVEEMFSRPGVPKLAFSAYWNKVVERQKTRQIERARASAVIDHVVDNVSRPQLAQDHPIIQRAAKVKKEDDIIKVDGNPTSEIESPNLPKQKTVPVAGSSGQLSVEDLYPQSALDSIKLDKDILPERRVSKLEKDDESLPGDKQRQKRKALAEQLAALSNQTDSDPNARSIAPLNEQTEANWVDLRVRLNQFLNDPNATPEQVTTLLSNCIYGFGDRLGDAAVDLLHGLMSSLKPEDLTKEHKLLLRNDYERLGLGVGRPTEEKQEIVRAVQERHVPTAAEQMLEEKVRYDKDGFGCQDSLATKIKGAKDMPLESLLESIKYASLIDSGPED